MTIMNPTQKSDRNDPSFVVEIKYNPVTGDLLLGGNIQDPMIFYGVMELAKRAYERNLQRNSDARIQLPIALPSHSIGPRGH